jgi:hypothetical protein
MGAPVPWHHFVKPALREAGNAGEHVGKPGLRIDIVELDGYDQSFHDRGTLESHVIRLDGWWRFAPQFSAMRQSLLF